MGAIDNSSYVAASIEQLPDLEAVRKRPSMYIGGKGEEGLHHLAIEVIDNSIDEHLEGHCSHIDVAITEQGGIIVRDDGRGIPIDEKKDLKGETKIGLEICLEGLHAGGKFGGGGYQVSGGLHGVGIAVVNFLSKKLRATVKRDGKIIEKTYERGVSDGEPREIGETDETKGIKSGTIIEFVPDEEIFETVEFDSETVREMLREQAFLNKGLIISFEDRRPGKERAETFRYDDGIVQYVKQMNEGKATLPPEPLYVCENWKETHNGKVEECNVEFALQYDDKYGSANIFTYANRVNTKDGGTHLDGFKFYFVKVANEYGRKQKKLNDKEKLTFDDLSTGLTAVISVILKEPEFEGQTKAKLGNGFMRKAVGDKVCERVGEYFEKNPDIAAEIVRRARINLNWREKARANLEAIRKNPMNSASLPGKLWDCTDKNPKNCEIYLVEGESAGGTAKDGRDRRFQAILPLKGKIMNVQKALNDDDDDARTQRFEEGQGMAKEEIDAMLEVKQAGRLKKVLGNEEIDSMIKSFGCGCKDKFDIEKLKYDRIICMTDADVDGSHIRILLLTFFYNFMPKLIETGHVYVALPPLYKLSSGKKVRYCYSDEELERAKAEFGDAKVDQQRYKGLGEMNAEQLFDTTMDPEKRTLLRVTMEDALEADGIFRDLMGKDSNPRKKFIEENAATVDVADLDI